MGTVIPPTHSWEKRRNHEVAGFHYRGCRHCWRFGCWGCALPVLLHAELGLQLNLQSLEHPPELIQRIAALLHQLAVKGRFFVQLLGLRQERTEGLECSRGPLAGKSGRRAEDPCPTLLRNQASVSPWFLSAICSYCSRISSGCGLGPRWGQHPSPR